MLKNLTLRQWEIALWAVLVIFLLMMSVRSIKDIWEVNDFEIWYMAAQSASEHRTDLWSLRSPVKNRPFLKPPGAALMLMPLSWFSEKGAGVFFSFLKIGVLAALMWGSVLMQEKVPKERAIQLAFILATTLIVLQPITSDIGNGQINLFVAFLALSGVWIIMESRGLWWVGSLLLAASIALKATPVLFLAVPFLFRKWKQFVVAIGATAFLIGVLPVCWYGADAVKNFSKEFEARSVRASLDMARRDRQVSFQEMFVFTVGQLSASRAQLQYDPNKRKLFVRNEDGKLKLARIRLPLSGGTIKMVWWSIVLTVGACYLTGRWRLRRRHALPWMWDLAVLAVLMNLLSPLVRRAHVVVLLFPVGYMVCRFVRMVMGSGGWKGAWQAHRGLLVTATVTLALFWLTSNLAIPVPGVFVMPYRPGLFFAHLGFILVLIQLARLEPAPEPP